MKKIYLILLAIILVTTTLIKLDHDYSIQTKIYKKHYCNLVHCKHQGEPMNDNEFISNNYPNNSKGYYIELMHFMHPEWTQKQCVDYVESGVY